MKPLSAIEFRNRPMQVKVFDLCEHCGQLRDDVKMREDAGYWPKYSLKITCCFPCYEIARKKVIDEAKAESAAYC